MDATARHETVVELLTVPTSGDGVAWSLGPSDDLNANLVHLDPAGEIGAHVNNEVDVLLLVLAGGGTVVVAGRTHQLGPMTLAHVPRSTERVVRAGDPGLTYLTVHRRRGPLTVGAPRAGSTPTDAPSSQTPSSQTPSAPGGS